MADVFEEAWEEADGWVGRLRVGLKATCGAVVHAVEEHRYRGPAGPRRGGGGMEDWVRDLRWAVRGMGRRPGFAALAVMTIGLGIASASGMFAVVDAVVLRSLPYPHADRLVAVWTSFEGQGDFGLSLAEHFDLAEESRTLEALGSWGDDSATLTGWGDARSVSTAWVWGDLFEVIGAGLTLGRLPAADERATGAPAVAVVSHRFWADVLGRDSSVVGRSVELDQESVEVIGVLDPEVRLPTSTPDVWLPIAMNRVDIADRSGHWLNGIGRLAAGASLAGLRAELEAVHRRWDVRFAGAHTPGRDGHAIEADEVHARYFGDLRSTGVVLLVAVLVVLLLACANVAAMLMARGEAREGELRLMWAMGAGRGRLLRALVVESLVLAGLGGGVGVGIAKVGLGALLRLEGATLPRVDMVALDVRVLAFSGVVTLVAAVIFGAAPAVRAIRRLGPSTRGSAGPDRSLARSLSTLVVGQIGFAVVLLAAAGLLLGTLQALVASDVGMDTSRRVTFEVSLTQPSYPEIHDIDEFWGRLTRAVEALPGVEAAAVVRLLPTRDALRREGVALEAAGGVDDARPIAFGVSSPGYFDVLGVPIVRGRDFGPEDQATEPLVALVNETAAAALWPGSSAVGRQVYPLFLPDSVAPVRVVGVVGDVSAEGPRAPVAPELYLSYAQMSVLRGYARTGTVIARTSGELRSLMGAIPGVVRRIDPEIAVTRLETMDEVSAMAAAEERFLATSLGIFAALALVLAAMGTYGVVSFAVARRGPEFGVRRALGASGPEIVRGVLARAGRLAAAGLAVGITGALAMGSGLEGFVFGVDARDPSFALSGALVMGAVVLLAAVVPAVRAGRQDPLRSLRDTR